MKILNMCSPQQTKLNCEVEDHGYISDQIFDMDDGEDEVASEQVSGDLENNEAAVSGSSTQEAKSHSAGLWLRKQPASYPQIVWYWYTDARQDYSRESDDDFIVQMDNSKGSKEGEEENDTVDAEDEFSLDFNHNDGNRIVMTLKRK